MPGQEKDSLINKIIAGYKIKHKLGQGGMSTVYYAEKDENVAAIKIILSNLLNDKTAVARFYREAESLKKLECPCIVRIFDFGCESGFLYIVMEYIEGKSLESILGPNAKITIPQALYIAREVAKGLCEMSEKGIIHRDIKPDNIMITPKGEVKITDFGLAKGMMETVALTEPGYILGTPYYMSPEQCMGEALDHRSDLYSLGAVLYEMLTYIPPFKGDSATTLFAKHLEEPVVWPESPQIPNHIKSIVETLMEKNKDTRYPSPKQLLEVIEGLKIPMEPLTLESTNEPGKDSLPAEKTVNLNCPGCGAVVPVSFSILRSRPQITCSSCSHCFSGEDMLSTDEWYSIFCVKEPVSSKSVSDSPLSYTSLTKDRKIGKYNIEREIGRGGMGVVYKVKEEGLDRTLALKVLITTENTQEDDIQRFKRGIKAAAKLRHPNIVAIHEAGVFENKYYYFTMDYIEGDTLDAKLKKERFTPRKSLIYIRDVGKAIDYAHKNGVLHRDIKPANILIDESDTPLVMDFGLAKNLSEENRLTQSGVILGTPSYMSPEQAQGDMEKIDIRSDVYSLGAMFYELLTRQPPHKAGSLIAAVYSVVKKDPVPIKKLAAGVHQDIVTICMKAMDKRPEKRYSSAGEMVEDIERFLEGRPITARPEGTLAKTWRFLVSTKIGGIYSFIILVIIGCFILGLIFFAYPRLHYHRGLAFMTLSRYLDAVQSFNRVLLIKSEHVPSLVYRGICNERLGHIDKAMADFNLAISADPDYFIAYIYRGYLYFVSGEDEKALKDYDQAVKLKPDHPLPYFFRGKLYLLKNEIDKAMEDFDAGLQLPLPDDPEYQKENWQFEKSNILFLIGVSSRLPGEEKECLMFIQKALEGGFDDYCSLIYMLPWDRLEKTEEGKKFIKSIPILKKLFKN